MSYLASSTYSAIRSDPTQIVDYFNSTANIFAADLNMPNIDTAALEAAWCCVVASGLAAYGSEPATMDLGELLEAPTLACDDYVTLAWELLDEFGDGSAASCTAVGWNGGAVGNHAQLLFDDGASQLLLDPTIGLVVDGVTMSGLTSGQAYGEMTSFYGYMADGLDDFNREVQQAVAGGLYRDRDAIYYVGDLAQWQAEGSGFYLPTVSIVDDASGSAPWLSITTCRDWDGRPLSIHYAERDGTAWDYSYDPGGTAPWRQIEQYTAANGGRLMIQYSERDGTSVVYQYDVGGTAPWSRIETEIAASGDVSAIVYSERDGTSAVYQYDVSGAAPWSRIETEIAASGNVSEIIYSERDGRTITYQYDVGGYRQLETIADASGHPILTIGT